MFHIPQIALAIGVLTSSIGVRVRRFCGFVLGGLSGKVSSEVSSDVVECSQSMVSSDVCMGGVRCRLMCVWLRVRGSGAGCSPRCRVACVYG